MTLILDLSPEQEIALRQKAAREGKGEREYALSLLGDALGVGSTEARPFYETATPEEWVKAWHEWTHSHPSNGPVLLNDSREIIYED
jgi:hypothetical protein